MVTPTTRRTETRRPARILWLTAELPEIDGQGGARRQFHQIRALAELGHHVHVVHLGRRRGERELRRFATVEPFGYAVRGRLHPWRLSRALSLPDRWDAIVVSHTESWWMLLPRFRPAGVPVLVDVHNVYSRWYGQRGQTELGEHWRGLERNAILGSDAVSVCSAAELERLQQMHPDLDLAGVVAPIGVDADEWPDVEYRRDDPMVALFGSWSWWPNARGLDWFAEEVWPRVIAEMPTARAAVAGSGADLRRPAPSGLRIVGRVENLAEFTARAAVVAVPVLDGVGAAMKFGESLASGAAVVATTDAAQAHPDAPALVSDDAAEWAAFILERLERRGAEVAPAPAREWVLEQANWHRAVAPIDGWLQSVLDRDRRASRRR